MYKSTLLVLLSVAIGSCNNKKKSPDLAQEKASTVVSYNDTAFLPFRTEDTAGYFAGYISEKKSELEESDSSHLRDFLRKILSKKEVVLLNKETLSHSVLIDKKKKKRTDTFKNKNTILVSEYVFDSLESQIIKLNEKVISEYKWNGIDSLQKDILQFDRNSFVHFSFHNKEYYYIRARIMNLYGTSAANISYHLLYSSHLEKLSIFRTCRLENILFGDADGDENLDYLDFDNSDFCTTIPFSDHVTIKLYSCNSKGNFIVQKNKKGQDFL
jgi:hypothetical protein